MKEKIIFPHIYHCSIWPGDKLGEDLLQGQIALLFPSATVGQFNLKRYPCPCMCSGGKMGERRMCFTGRMREGKIPPTPKAAQKLSRMLTGPILN